MSENILSNKLTRRTFLKATAATAAVAAVGDKLFGGPISSLVESAAAAPTVTEDKWIPTACRGCRMSEPIRVHVVDGVAVKIEGIPEDPINQGRTCGRSHVGIMNLYNPYRVKSPMKRTNPEKGLGVDPEWVEITWDEALDTVASKLKPVLEKDPREFMFNYHADIFASNLKSDVIEKAFGKINKTWMGGTTCGGGVHIALQRTLGDNSLGCDWDYCNYLINFGTCSYGTGKAHVPPMRGYFNARSRGMKVVVVDPALSDQARKADEWIPIRPATDQAFALAMLNALVHEFGLVDWEHIRLRTNGPYLIAPDGDYVRSKTETYIDEYRLNQTFGKPYIWDPVDNKAKLFDDPTIKDFALEGTYTVDGVQCQPAFQVFKDFLKPYTAEWAEPITTVPAKTIRRVAKEFGEASQIGATMTFYDHPDGPATLPYRPVVATARKGSQGHFHAVLISRAIFLLHIITGAANVVGSSKGAGGLSTNPVAGPDGVLAPKGRWKYKFTYPPQTISLKDMYPPAWGEGHRTPHVLLHPEKYPIDFRIKVRLVNYTNSMKAKANPEIQAEALKKVPFGFAISYHFDEETEMCDIVFPEPSWLERWEIWNPKNDFSFDWKDSMVGFTVLRHPVVEPLYNTRQGADIMMEIAARMGMLAKWNEAINSSRKLKDEYKLAPDVKYEWKDVCDRELKTKWGADFGVAWFEVNGFKGSAAKGRKDWYAYTKHPKSRQPLYDDWFPWMAKQLRADRTKAGLPEVPDDFPELYGEMIPLPEWRGMGPLEQAAPEFDLYAFNSGNVFSIMCMGMDNPWISEFSQRFNPYLMGVWINSATAQKKGIKNGDRIKITSDAGHTVEGEALLTECVHPECVGIMGCYGSYSANMNPIAKLGTHFNYLLSSDLSHYDPLGGNDELSPKVKIYKA